MYPHILLFRQRSHFFAALLFMAVFFSSCSGKVLFQSNFDTNTVDQPPAPAQQVGTIQLSAPTGAVLIKTLPAVNNGKWVQITRTNDPTSITNMQCNNATLIGNGEYSFSSVLFIPTGSGVSSIQFERSGQPAGDVTGGFLHLDFTEDNMVRIDDKEDTKFGSFSRGKAFMVTVNLKINATGPSTAHIALGGDGGATGSADYTIQSPFLPSAHQFGAVRFWIGFPHVGTFYASTIVVKQLNK